MKTFEEVWKEMQAQGYQYGDEELEHVKLGWNLALEAASVHIMKAAIHGLETGPGKKRD